MSGVSVINSLASAAAAVTALVPAAQIASGAIVLQGPDASLLPAVSVKSIDSMEATDVAMTGSRLITERVQVTVYASSYAAKLPILLAIRDACVRQRGTIAGVRVDSIMPAEPLLGPDLDEPGDPIFELSLDLLVRWFH